MSDSNDETVEEIQGKLILIIKNIIDKKKLKFYKQFITKMEEVD